MTKPQLEKRYGVTIAFRDVTDGAGRWNKAPDAKKFAIQVRPKTSRSKPAKPLRMGIVTVGTVSGRTGSWEARTPRGFILRTGLDTRAQATDQVLRKALDEGRLPISS